MLKCSYKIRYHYIIIIYYNIGRSITRRFVGFLSTYSLSGVVPRTGSRVIFNNPIRFFGIIRYRLQSLRDGACSFQTSGTIISNTVLSNCSFKKNVASSIVVII